MTSLQETSDLKEVVVTVANPKQSDVTLSINDVSETGDDVNEDGKKKPHTDDIPQYDTINISAETNAESPNKGTPKSVYTLGGSAQKPKLELTSREVSTRQCKFEISEEWEQFQIIKTGSVSCPSSPLGGRREYMVHAHDNLGYAASEPGAEIDHDHTDASVKQKDPFPFHFLFSTPSSSGLKEHHIVPNPYNKVNQRFHSTLQCPCFLFFFFLCCLPGVHFMQQSDNQFKKGNRTRAQKYSKMSTIMYITGTVVGVAFLSVAIYFAAEYVKQFM